MQYEIVISIIGAMQAVVIAIVYGISHRETKRRKLDNDRVERRALCRAEESLLAMRLMSANTSLSMATAIAVREGKSNGEMEKAIIDAKAAQQEYYDLVNKIASKELATD